MRRSISLFRDRLKRAAKRILTLSIPKARPVLSFAKRATLFTARRTKGVIEKALSAALGRSAELHLVLGPPQRAKYGAISVSTGPSRDPAITVIGLNEAELERLGRARRNPGDAQEIVYQNRFYRIVKFPDGDIGIATTDGSNFLVSTIHVAIEGEVANRRIAQANLLAFSHIENWPIWNETELVTRVSGVLDCQIGLFCKADSPEIRFAAQSAASADEVKLSKLSIEFQVAQPVRELYLKNRKVLRRFLKERYWLDRQGAAFGCDEQSLIIYHSPEVSSLEFNHLANRLIVNLDASGDHPMMIDNPSGSYKDASCSILAPGDRLEAKFSLWAAFEPKILPRLMSQPKGYVSTHVWTEHACFTHERVHRAVYFGSDQVTSSGDAVGGFVKAGIPVTKSVFYDNPERVLNDPQTSHFKGPMAAIRTSENFEAFLNELSQLGHEICLHCAAPRTSTDEEMRTALNYMKESFDSVSWIDHIWYKPDGDKSGCIESFCCQGLSNYGQNHWQNFGVRYFWNPYYEYYSAPHMRSPSESLDHWTWDPAFPNPLYWRHPTLTKGQGPLGTRSAPFISFATWEAWTPGDPTKDFYQDRHLAQLVDDWGIRVSHCYPTYVGDLNAAWEVREDGAVVTSQYFEQILARLVKLQEQGYLWNATLRDLLGYLVDLEKIEIRPDVESGGVRITNANGTAVEGLSLACDLDSVVVDGKKTSGAWRGNQYVFWFDLPPHSSVVVSISH